MSSKNKSQYPQSELETLIRGANFTSQSSLNSYLQPHGLSGQINDDGTAAIFDESTGRNKVATVQFNQPETPQRQITGIMY